MIAGFRGIALAVAALVGLNGCIAGSAVMTGAEMASVVNTDKTLVDHAASWITGKDCSSIHSANGYSYCDEPYVDESAAVPRYCYRSLGAITCYDRPDPYGTHAARVE